MQFVANVRRRTSTTARTGAVRPTAATTAGGETTWSRSRLLGILATLVAVVLALVLGLAWAVWHVHDEASGENGGVQREDAVMGSSTDDPNFTAGARGAAHRDQVAAAPMLQAPASAAQPPPGAAQGTGGTGAADSAAEAAPMAGEIEIPDGGITGPAFVETGFPHTPTGALGQLAQIEVSVLESMSLPNTALVHQAWVLPGGAGVAEWRLSVAVQAFLDAAEMPGAKDPTASVSLTPVGGLIKGTDGPDWVVACVLAEVSGSYQQQQSQTSFGHCERMQWAGGRWLVAPGAPPAPAPSTWPGTDLATEAGWRTWRTHQNPVSDAYGNDMHQH